MIHLSSAVCKCSARSRGRHPSSLPNPSAHGWPLLLSSDQSHLCPAVFRALPRQVPQRLLPQPVCRRLHGAAGERLPGNTHPSGFSGPRFREPSCDCTVLTDVCSRPGDEASLSVLPSFTTYLVTLGNLCDLSVPQFPCLTVVESKVPTC